MRSCVSGVVGVAERREKLLFSDKRGKNCCIEVASDQYESRRYAACIINRGCEEKKKVLLNSEK